MKPIMSVTLLWKPLFKILFRDREEREREPALSRQAPAFSPRNLCGQWVLSVRQHSSKLAFLLEKGADGSREAAWAAALHQTASGPRAQLCTRGWRGAGACLMVTSRKRKERSSISFPSLALLLKNTNKLPEKQQAFWWARSFPLVLFVY